MVLYLAADLLWASKVKATAEAVGVAARPVRTLEMLEARLADSHPTAILLDLDKPQEAMAMIGRLRGAAAAPAERSLRIIAWGPHVATELLREARQAGADEVLTRGAMEHRLEAILREVGSNPK